jgi:glycosyltransferase involved in cell wall biosynthesis
VGREAKIQRVFYVSAGGADIIQSHEFWRQGVHNPNEVSITFSGQIEDFVREIGADAYLVSARADARIVQDGSFTVEHRVRSHGRGLGYYWAELRYCLGLVRTARSFGADLALVDSGVVPFFMMTLFRLAGIPVVPILHNCLWPNGFRPKGGLQAIVQWLDRAFWRRVPKAIIAVSPEAERQVDEIAGTRHPPVWQIRAQFLPDYFAHIPPPDADAVPFRVMFIGRVVEHKGVLDIPDMARRVEARMPGQVRWTICGRGAALERLRDKIFALGLQDVVTARGWTSLEDLQQIYAESHASIVPTRSGFAEGLAMTAAEAILAGRPIVSNPIVPALELLEPAAMGAKSNDADSHADAVAALAGDRALYRKLQENCVALRAQFYDRDQGLAAVLRRALSV